MLSYLSFKLKLIQINSKKGFGNMIINWQEEIKLSNCDEKTLNNLRKDWISLNIVRDFVKKGNKKN